jgi:CubicO group peptidase (beta-lactamase class C family)
MFIKVIIPLLSFILLACGSSSNKNNEDTSKQFNAVTFAPIQQNQRAYYASLIKPLYEKQLVKTGFNGSILLAKNGEIVFEDYRGFINLATKEVITPHSTFHLASITKTFTAMTILKLMEQGRLNIDDNINKYLPDFTYHNITIKNLLSHRSGLPKYERFLSATRSYVTRVKNRRKRWVNKVVYVTDPIRLTGLSSNYDVLKYLNEVHPPVESLPNYRYQYCNTNYALLAIIIEKITGQTYPKYMKDSVFTPLGMNDTYVFSMKDTANYIPSYKPNGRPYSIEKLDCIYGDKNIYSTVRDLLKWDNALYAGIFISPKTFALSIEPLSNETKGFKNYGLGWHLFIKPPEPTIVYHNGWWHGNNTVFKRLISDTATVIILGNKFNRNIWTAGKFSSVFTGMTDTTTLEQ